MFRGYQVNRAFIFLSLVIVVTITTTTAAFGPHPRLRKLKCQSPCARNDDSGIIARLDIGATTTFVTRQPHSVALFGAESDDENIDNNGPKVTISYCTGCRWLLRAAWLAQELLTTFQNDLGGVELIPSRPPAPGGIFIVTIDGTEIWNRSEVGRFPEAKELKQKIRDVIDPQRDLGHSDVKKDVLPAGNSEKCEDCPPAAADAEVEEMDDDEAAAARRHFGVA
mmetsp:Transcript_26365/g.40827  ORF Transcript_26365/g.40827 Transcript_26365/m.40827 type:complete len:224 (-) Transcript_26365:115-786(-)